MWGFKPKTRAMSRTEVMTRLPREIVDAGNAISNDRFYEVPVDPQYIMKKVPSWKLTYIHDKHDCDDFVRDFRGWLSRKGFGSLLAMDTELLLKNGVRHNLISFIDLLNVDLDGKNKLVFGEPQTGLVVTNDGFQNIKLRL